MPPDAIEFQGTLRKTNVVLKAEFWNNWPLTGRKCAAECYGVLMFVFVGTLSSTMTDTLGTFAPGVVHGFTIAALIISLGHISGGHFNPAVTIAVAITRNIHPILGVLYIFSQLLGSVLGAFLLRLVLPEQTYCDIAGGSVTITLERVGKFNALVLEVMNTYFLVQTVLNAAVDSDGSNVLAPLAIGLSILVDICVSGDKSGASMNPARSFGPALAYTIMHTTVHSNRTTRNEDGSIGCPPILTVWDGHWIYWLGPGIGAIIAAILYNKRNDELLLLLIATLFQADFCHRGKALDSEVHKVSADTPPVSELGEQSECALVI